MTKTTMKALAIGIAVGTILSATVFYLFAPNTHSNQANVIDTKAADSEPLYWVAPMDPNFKRDKPGKSPMGMDLVPVFADETNQNSSGTVSIDPVTIQNLGVKTTLVKKISPKSSINTFGEVKFAEDKILHIHPRVEGWVERLSVRTKGDFIEQGEALYSLYAPDLVNAQEEFLIALQQGNKALISAAQSRLSSLNAPQSLIESIRESRKITRTITYYAPQSGYISQLNIQEGFYVKPSTTMLAIASLDSVWVVADIFASDASKINIGQRATILNEYLPQSEISTSVDYIYPTLDADTRTVKARFTLENTKLSLKPGMYVDVLIDALSSLDSKMILAVPKQAVIRTGDSDRAVLSLGEGRYKSINIQLGRVFDDVFEVLSGLQEGDEIVSSAQFLLDSESSINSDFMRMQTASQNMKSEPDTFSDISAWTQATVNEVMFEERMINLTHGPLDEFNMMGMTMNFTVAESIDMQDFSEGQEVHVEIIKAASGMYQVRTVHFMEEMDNMPEGDKAQ